MSSAHRLAVDAIDDERQRSSFLLFDFNSNTEDDGPKPDDAKPRAS
jgi:hypothetical protein